MKLNEQKISNKEFNWSAKHELTKENLIYTGRSICKIAKKSA